MSKDPAFLFYPGDYLRDTQTLSEKAQVAYDRIMCEHMRNICITQKQLNFFTKRLSEDEIEEVMFLLDKVNGGYQIGWVAESINKRRQYSDSRRKNRQGKKSKSIKNTSKTYDSHMEIEDVNENEIEHGINTETFKLQWKRWKKYLSDQHDFIYHSADSEQSAVMDLVRMANADEKKAIELINYAITKGWKSIYPIGEKATYQPPVKSPFI